MNRFLWLLLVTNSLMASQIHLNVAQGGLLSTKIIHSVFSTMGFKVNIERYSNADETVQMDLQLQGRKPFDSKLFLEMLSEHQVSADKGLLSNKQWVFNLNASQAVWNLNHINVDEGAQLKRSSIPYWFDVSAARAIAIEAPYGIKWYPDVAVFDSAMHVLVSYRAFKQEDRLIFELPSNSAYLKISNANGMKILKEGMWVEHATE